MLTSRKNINSHTAHDAVSQELYMHNTFTPEVLTRREILVNNIVSSSLIERVLTPGGEVRWGAVTRVIIYPRHCDECEFTPEAIQKNAKFEVLPISQNTFTTTLLIFYPSFNI